MMPTKKEIVDFYEEYPRQISTHLLDSKFKASEILSALQKKKITKISTAIDLGCGAGGVSKELERAIQSPIVGCDISSSLLRIAKKTNKNLLLVKADCENIPIRNDAMDLVLMIDSLEHLVSPAKAMAESARISKRWVILITPFENSWYRNLKQSDDAFLSGWKFNCGHLWKFDLLSMRKLLELNGLRMVEVYLCKFQFSHVGRDFFLNSMRTILTTLMPRSIYRRLFSGEYLILAECARKRNK